jgi:hypothetical protein
MFEIMVEYVVLHSAPNKKHHTSWKGMAMLPNIISKQKTMGSKAAKIIMYSIGFCMAATLRIFD